MGLVSFLSSLYLVFTIILLFRKNDMGNIYILFGGITFLFVIGYGYIPYMPEKIQSFGIFIVFFYDDFIVWFNVWDMLKII